MPERGQHNTPHARSAALVEALAIGLECETAIDAPAARRRTVSLKLRRAWGAALRLTHHEFWPARVFLLPLFPWIFWLGARYGGLRTCTCANPGIANGGGVLGESKSEVLAGLAGDAALHARLVEAGPTPEERAKASAKLIEADDRLGGYPIILKPDAGERGYGVALIRDASGLEPYFRRITIPAIAQRYDPGPCEYGVLWVRELDSVSDNKRTPCGSIFSITKKSFPELTGDGTHTLEQLILRHKRYRKQAKLFLRRHAAKLDWTPGDGERVVLGHAGNHAQGAIFSDGSDLITPELSARIDEIARGYRGIGGGGFDFGRIDLRCPSEEDFRAGRNLSIIELNGVFSESTNLYDPDRSVFWAYSVLFTQWKRVYELGAARKRTGVRPIGARELARTMLAHRKTQRRPWTGA